MRPLFYFVRLGHRYLRTDPVIIRILLYHTSDPTLVSCTAHLSELIQQHKLTMVQKDFSLKQMVHIPVGWNRTSNRKECAYQGNVASLLGRLGLQVRRSHDGGDVSGSAGCSWRRGSSSTSGCWAASRPTTFLDAVRASPASMPGAEGRAGSKVSICDSTLKFRAFVKKKN